VTQIDMNYCNSCGGPLRLDIPPGEDRQRHICEDCGTVHYLNPRVVVCAIPAWGEQILLCRRAIEPRHGFWTLPGGFMENGESTLETASRETVEEACARIKVGELFALFNIIHINQVQLFFRAELCDLDFAPGPESLETALFHEHEIPWDEMAFPAVATTLREYFKDRATGNFQLRMANILLGEDQKRLFKPLNFVHDQD
jgi:ADP-ribose pyrophosphatase YjhB (NUDIX family)